ncbi:YndM family protein [Bacillus sp. SCS-153A]|uniref:YndM family protein n=1 Tax=Rossellomorea sedimentorum TaxID=3115294 RepID=UPI0039067879
MKIFNIIVVKFVASLVVFWVSLDLFFEATTVDIVSFSLLLTIVSYLVGDRILLPRIGKMNTLVTDFFLTYLIVWIFGGILFDSYLQVAWGSIISALLITVSEVFVHSSILENIPFEVRETSPSFNRSFAYEFAEEQDPNPEKE